MQLSETINRIKQHGVNNASVVPDGKGTYKIIVNTTSGQVTLRNGLTQSMAEDIIRQAKDRVLLG